MSITERAKSLTDWILRRDGMLKHAGLQELMEKELKKQRENDIEQACKWLKDNFTKGDNIQRAIWMKFIDEFRKEMEK